MPNIAKVLNTAPFSPDTQCQEEMCNGITCCGLLMKP